MSNRGDVVLPVKLDGFETAADGVQNFYASATHDDKTGEVIIKAVNPGADAQTVQVKLPGLTQIEPEGKAVTLAGDRLDAVNSMSKPTMVAPVESKFENAAADFSYTFPARSMTVLRIKAK